MYVCVYMVVDTRRAQSLDEADFHFALMPLGKNINQSILSLLLVSVSLFNDISTFAGYLRPKPSLNKNCNGPI